MVVSSALICIVASLVLSIVYWRVNRVHIYLFLFIFSVNLFAILHHFIFYNGPVFWLAVLYNHFVPLFYLAGPMLFFYIRAITEDRQGSAVDLRKDLLHFLPAFISLVGIVPYLFRPFDQKLQLMSEIVADPNNFKVATVNWIIPTWMNSILRPSLLLVYSFISFRLLWHFRLGKRASTPISQLKLAMRWLYSLVAVTTAIALIYLLMVVLYFQTNNVTKLEDEIHGLTVLMNVLVLMIPVMIIVFPQLLYGIPRETKAAPVPLQSHEATAASEPEAEVQEDDVPTEMEPFKEKAAQIMSYIVENQLYLDPDFNIDSIATGLKIPRNHVYYCFSHVINEKFTVLRSRLRVEYAQKLLLGEDARTLSMDGIAAKAGFPSRSRFFVVFKEVTGMTPGEFMNSQP